MTHPRHKILSNEVFVLFRIYLTLLGEVVHDESEDIVGTFRKSLVLFAFERNLLTEISTSIVGDQVEDLDEFKRGILISLHVSGDADEDGVLDNRGVSIQRDDFVFNLWQILEGRCGGKRGYGFERELFNTIRDFLDTLVVVTFETHDGVISVELKEFTSVLLEGGVIGFDELLSKLVRHGFEGSD